MSERASGRLHDIADVARSAGITSRTLRHYGDVGILPATDTSAAGHRYYDDLAVVRLQRILMLRDLGLGLAEIRRILDHEQDDLAALTEHLDWLERERDRVTRQLAAVRDTLTTLQEGRPMNTDDALDGFSHDSFREEVRERWGDGAWERGQSWWGAKTPAEQEAFRAEQRSVAQDAAALAAGPHDPAASLRLAERQLAWLRQSTPDIDADRLRALADMYVADERFSRAYDAAGRGGAAALAGAMRALADEL